MKRKVKREREKERNSRKEKGLRADTVNAKIIDALNKHNDLTRQGLAEFINEPLPHVTASLTVLRKHGYRIFPFKGPGTPLRLARTESDMKRYMDWRRHCYLGTTKLMITDEFEIGETFPALAENPKALLAIINSATKQYAKLSNGAGN